MRFYDNYAISGFILTVSDNIYTDRSKIIAGEKSTSLSMEFSSNGVTFHSNTSRKLHYRLLAYYKWFVVSGGTGLCRTTRFFIPKNPPRSIIPLLNNVNLKSVSITVSSLFIFKLLIVISININWIPSFYLPINNIIIYITWVWYNH